ncbi:hypothetical protein TNCT_478791 [Trichonephila clavata]|uniref:Uncharacterized protein n=1 Tax=Trichonephila clavata TaxID=2740835 RepID=A0A8X6F9G3_TRICU|nr:hypothetical protein TNCT_478791 [Trichonephila clavata]
MVSLQLATTRTRQNKHCRKRQQDVTTRLATVRGEQVDRRTLYRRLGSGHPSSMTATFEQQWGNYESQNDPLPSGQHENQACCNREFKCIAQTHWNHCSPAETNTDVPSQNNELIHMNKSEWTPTELPQGKCL